MNNPLNSATPEQKLYILTAELKAPIDTIRGYAALIKKDIETNRAKPEEILEKINKIAEIADKIKELRDEILRS